MLEKCLIVDDHPMIRESIAVMTQSLGFNDSFLASDGSEAISKIYHDKPSIIITDLQMEPMDGLELLKLIRSGRYGLPFDIPIIVLTANSAENVISECILFDVDAFLVKPVNKRSLQTRINQILTSPKTKKNKDFYFSIYKENPIKINRFNLNGEILFLDESFDKEINEEVSVENQLRQDQEKDTNAIARVRINKSKNFIKWQDQFYLGNTSLDNGNKIFVDIINATYEMMQESDITLNRFETVMNAFKNYVESHIPLEEKLLKEKKFADYEEHKKLHYQLIKQCDYILLKCKADPETYASQFFKLLRFWWLRHVVQEDTKYKNLFK